MRHIVAMRALKKHLNLRGVVHGGVLAALVDTAFGIVIVALARAAPASVTVNLASDFLEPVREGDWVEAHVEIQRTGKRLVVRAGDAQGGGPQRPARERRLRHRGARGMSRRVHVLTKKEELDAERLPGKVVIVLDVLFATTTIAAALAAGAAEVVPALDAEGARAEAKGRAEAATCWPASCARRPSPGSRIPRRCCSRATRRSPARTLIYSTTNGTVALAKSGRRSEVYAAALVNARAVVEHVQRAAPGGYRAARLLGIDGELQPRGLLRCRPPGELFARTRRRRSFSDAALAARKLHDGTQRGRVPARVARRPHDARARAGSPRSTTPRRHDSLSVRAAARGRPSVARGRA